MYWKNKHIKTTEKKQERQNTVGRKLQGNMNEEKYKNIYIKMTD